MDGAVRAGDLDAGEALLADMRAAGCRPNDYILNSLLRGYCCREGRPPEVRWFKSACMQARILSCFVLSLRSTTFSLMTMYSVSYSWYAPECQQTLKCLPLLSHQNLCPGGQILISVALHILTTSSSSWHDFLRYMLIIAQDALRLLRDMRGMGVAPTAVTFNTLMDACLARGAPAAVPRLFRALLGAGLAPDAVSYTTLVAAFARLGRPDDAVRRS